MKTPYKNFDLPTHHLTDQHYIPARTRRADEAERRRALPRGTILREYERDGLANIRHIVAGAEDDRDFAFIQDILAACALNSSWYTYAQQAERMRRTLTLPTLFDPETGERREPSALQTDAVASLDLAIEQADGLVAAHTERRLKPRQLFVAGRAMGNTALKVSALSLGTATYGLSPAEASVAVRRHGLATVERARTLQDELGVNASAAQLADPNSEVSVYIRRHAPDRVSDLFEEVLEIRRAA